jgi:methyl-accepting chemotaxis protein
LKGWFILAVKRSIYLINPGFQLKFSFFVSSLVFIPSLLYPLTIYQLINMIVEQFPDLMGKLQANKSELIMLLIAWQLAFTGMVFIICIFQSHKIAGPMYKLKNYLDDVIKGGNPGHLFFRKGDNFQDIADDFNQAFSAIQEKYAKDIESIGSIKDQFDTLIESIPDDKKPIAKEIGDKLQSIKEKYKA